MAITSQVQLAQAVSKKYVISRTGTATLGSAHLYYASYALAGNIPAGVLAGTNTASGVALSAPFTGFQTIQNTGSSNYYLGEVAYNVGDNNTVTANVSSGLIIDLLYKAGPYPFNANTTLTSQPSIASRVPNGDYSSVVIAFESVTSFTNNPTVTVGYVNQSGVSSRFTTTTTFSGAGSGPGSISILPFQLGDSGAQRINSVQCTTSTAGTFNILMFRILGRVSYDRMEGYSKTDILNSGLVEVYPTSLITLLQSSPTGTTTLHSFCFEILS
jgi:hypothetical protein